LSKRFASFHLWEWRGPGQKELCMRRTNLQRRGAGRRAALCTALAIALPGAAGALAAGATPAAAATASVTINATAGLGTIPPGAIGLNTAVYDGYMNDTPIPGLLRAAGVSALRYPGGSYGDIFNWQTNTATGGYDAPNTSFDNFMTTANAIGASPVIITNYGTGTPSLAASWVQNANVTHSYGIKYWEVGNEVYGNGFYGAQWEQDNHSSKSPDTYATNFLQFQSAMKAVDSSIHVCAVLTTPGFWPDGVVGSGDTMDWNHTVLSILKSNTDCVIVHYYPGGSSAANMLTDPSDIAGIMSTLHSEVNQYAGSNASKVQVIVTETNSTIDMDTQPAALFAPDMYMTWLENGAVNIDWWNEHNGAGTPSTVNGAQDYGDQGIFSNGSNSSGVTEPAPETPFAPYYGIEMLSKLGSAGDQMVNATSSNALVKVHAVRRTGGNLDVLIDNEDPGNSYTLSLAYNGFTPNGTPTVFTFANNAHSVTSTTQSSTSSVTVSPYSLTVVQIPGSGGTGVTAPGAPGQPTVSGLSSSTSGNNSGVATLNWPASAPGTYPIANYQVYRQGSGGSSTLVGTTTSTSFSLSGLTIGTTYTYNVVAVDNHNNPSLPSPPVTFTVPPPSNSSCAVHWALNSSWPGGFGASITMTNKGTGAINGWTLTFTWPDPGEAVQSGWNGNWSQSGSNVTVTNASWNGTIAANGGTVSVGFNGTDTGQVPAPNAFFINGTICSNN
jgi:Cellulose binding domain/Fibronectin type III domain